MADEKVTKTTEVKTEIKRVPVETEYKEETTVKTERTVEKEREPVIVITHKD